MRISFAFNKWYSESNHWYGSNITKKDQTTPLTKIKGHRHLIIQLEGKSRYILFYPKQSINLYNGKIDFWNWEKIPKETKEKYPNLITERLSKINSLLSNSTVDRLVYENDISYKNHDIRKLIPKKYFELKNVISQFGGKLLYIKSGSTGHTFKGINLDDDNKNTDDNSYAIKVVAYPKKIYYGDMYDAKRPENAELLMIKLLSYFVIKNQSPHIILPITTFNTSIKPFINLKQSVDINEKNYNNFLQRYKEGDYYQNVSILISEWANEGDLLDFLRKKYQDLTLIDWTIIFFQIISVLAVIQNKYPFFRHNDMKANNLLVHKIQTSKDNNKFKYKINGQTYIVPNIGIIVKIIFIIGGEKA